MHKMTLRIVIVGLLLLGMAQVALAAPGDAADNALQWLAAAQNTDGGFSNGFTPESDIGATADAVVAIASSGQDVNAWQKGGASPLDYLAAQARAGNIKGAGLAAKVALAVSATSQDAANFAGTDLLALIEADFKRDTNLYGSSVFDHTLALLALSNAGKHLSDSAVTALIEAQADDGAWSFTGDKTPGAGDTNTTSLAVQALIAAEKDNAVAEALGYFKKVQNPDGGFTYQKPSQFGEDTDANSTALVIQALLAAGEKLENWAVNGKDPATALLALQRPSGAFSFNARQADENVLATIQAIPALNGMTLAQMRLFMAAWAPGAVPAQVTPALTTLPPSGGQPVGDGGWVAVAAAGLALVLIGGMWQARARRSG